MISNQTPCVGVCRWIYDFLPNSRCGNRDVEVRFPTELHALVYESSHSSEEGCRKARLRLRFRLVPSLNNTRASSELSPLCCQGGAAQS